MSYADDQTQAMLDKLEKKIVREYSKAYKEACATWDHYINGYDEIEEGRKIHHKSLAERFKEQYEAFQRGEYTEEEFKNWYKAQIERGNGYKKLCDDISKRVSSANQVASAYINDLTPSIYSLHANYDAYSIMQAIGEGIEADFQLVNEQTVKALMHNENFSEFRVTSINPKRDYEWNYDQIQSAITSGILQGKSIDQLTDSFMVVMKRNRASAIRNARTASTSAQNGGRIHSMQEAEKMGINVKKQWHSMEDTVVRFSHALLNGQIRKLNEKFSNGLQFPADPNGAPAEVYNCRCRLEYVLPDYETVSSNERWEQMSPEERKEEERRYKEWQREQAQKEVDK